MNPNVSSGAADELQRSRGGAEPDARVTDPVVCGQGAGSGEQGAGGQSTIVALILKSFPLNDLLPYRPTALPPDGGWVPPVIGVHRGFETFRDQYQ